MHNNNNTTHQCDPALSGSCGLYFAGTAGRTDGHTSSLWVWPKAARETSLNSAPLAGPNQFHGQNAPFVKIWRPSLVCTSQPHSARNDDLLLLLGSTVQSSIIHSATGGSTLPFSRVESNGSGTSNPRFQTSRDMPPLYLSIHPFPLAFVLFFFLYPAYHARSWS